MRMCSLHCLFLWLFLAPVVFSYPLSIMNNPEVHPQNNGKVCPLCMTGRIKGDHDEIQVTLRVIQKIFESSPEMTNKNWEKGVTDHRSEDEMGPFTSERGINVIQSNNKHFYEYAEGLDGDSLEDYSDAGSEDDFSQGNNPPILKITMKSEMQKKNGEPSELIVGPGIDKLLKLEEEVEGKENEVYGASEEDRDNDYQLPDKMFTREIRTPTRQMSMSLSLDVLRDMLRAQTRRQVPRAPISNIGMNRLWQIGR